MSAELESAFQRLAPRPTGPPPVQDIIRRARRQRRRGVVQVVAVAAVVALAAPVAVTGARSLLREPGPPKPAGPVFREVSAVKIDGSPHSVAFAEGSVWVPTSEGTVQRIDPESDEVTATIRVLDKERSGARLVGENGEDLGPAPASPRGMFGSITTGEGAVWATAHLPGGCRLFKIAPAKNAVTDEVETPCYPLLVADGSVWVGAGQDDGRPNHLIELDATTLDEVGRVDVGACCMSGIAYSGGHIWVGRQDVSNSANEGGGDLSLDMELDVLRIDPEAETVINEIALEGDTYHSGDTLLSNNLAAHPDAVWITRPEAGVVERIGLPVAVKTSAETPELRMPDLPVAGAGWLAVSDLNGSKMALLDADTAEVLEVYETGIVIGGQPATDRHFLWVPDAEKDRLVKLRVQG